MSTLPPNATTSYTFPGYNLSEPYPGSFLPESQFTFDISVWGNVQFSNSSSFQTWTEFGLTADESLAGSDNFTIDESWWFCARFFVKTMSAGDEVDENCEGFVSDDCLQSLKNLASGTNYCDSYGRPDSCDGDDFLGYAYSFDEALHTYDGYRGETGLLEDGNKVSFSGLFSGRHQRDNYTDYDATIREVAISIFGFAHAPRDNRTEPGPVHPGNLKCLVAKPQEGSRSLEEGSGTRVAPIWIGALLVLMSTLFML